MKEALRLLAPAENKQQVNVTAIKQVLVNVVSYFRSLFFRSLFAVLSVIIVSFRCQLGIMGKSWLPVHLIGAEDSCREAMEKMFNKTEWL
jgi:hypothetical protein